MGSIVIGVAGGSGSGKSTFTNRIKEYFGDASGITILSDEKGTTVTIRCHFPH